MIYLQPLVSECPEDIEGNQKLVLNVIINAKQGQLGVLSVSKLSKHSQLGLTELQEIIDELAKKNLIHKDEWA